MKKNFLYMLLSIWVCNMTYSQKREISGILVDKENHQPLELATVHLESLKDSTLLGYAISTSKGKYELQINSKQKLANLIVNFLGYQPLKKEISLNKKEIELDTLQLAPASESLDAVVITKRKPPVVIKKDTIEFNTDAFKTKSDAMAEDLLKKLPGVEVLNDGTVKVNGQKVTRILVNGKSFFGGDTKMATQNIPKEIIKKIVVTDKKTAEERLTNKDAESDEKQINIVLKKKNNKGVFGQITAGAGNDERYDGYVNFNYFDKKDQLTILGFANNINKNLRDYNFRYNGPVRYYGGGITTASNISSNFSKEIDKNTRFNIDGSHHSSTRDEENKNETIYLLETGNTSQNSKSLRQNHLDQTKLNSKFSLEKKKNYQLTLSNNLSFNESENISERASNSFGIDEEKLNSRTVKSRNTGKTNSYSGRLSFSKVIDTANNKFASIDVNTSIRKSEQVNISNSVNSIFGTNPSVTNVNLNHSTNTNNTDYSVDLKYGQNFGKKFSSEIVHTFSTNKNEAVDSYFNLDNQNQIVDFDTNLSTNNTIQIRKHIPALTFRYKLKRFNAGITAGYQFIKLKSDELIRNSSIDKNFRNPYFSGSLNFRFKDNSSIRTSYKNTVRTPNAYQLIEVSNSSNPFYIRTGNPNLKPSVDHRFSIYYYKYNHKKKENFNVSFYATATENAITSINNIDENLITTSTFTNLNGNYRLSTYSSYRKTIKNDIWSYSFRPSINGGVSVRNNFRNQLQYTSNVYNVRPSLDINFDYNGMFHIEPGYSLSKSFTQYNTEELENTSNENHSLGVRVKSFWPKNLEITQSFSFNYRPDVSSRFDRTNYMWNIEMNYKIWRKKALLKLQVYDLLNQNQNIYRYFSGTEEITSETNILRQYFVFSFSYKFNTLGKNKRRSTF